MEKAIEHLIDQFNGIRWGMITSGVIDTMKVECYGQKMPIVAIARTCDEAGRISVSPYDPSLLGSIEKALKAEGLNAYVFSKTSVVVSLPKWQTTQDKERVATQVRKLAEEAKVTVRNIRKKTRQKITGSEDEIKQAEKELQVATDDAIKRIDSLTVRKLSSL